MWCVAIHFPTICREVLWATRPQVTKVAMLGYSFIPSWGKVLRCNLHQFGICSLAELDKIAYFDISCYDSYKWKLNTASYKILLMGKPHIYTNIFLVSPNCQSCYMEALSQIQNPLCLLLLHLCSSFFHYLTLDQVGPRLEPQTETEETIWL